jgi:hypothetical protein
MQSKSSGGQREVPIVPGTPIVYGPRARDPRKVRALEELHQQLVDEQIGQRKNDAELVLRARSGDPDARVELARQMAARMRES